MTPVTAERRAARRPAASRDGRHYVGPDRRGSATAGRSPLGVPTFVAAWLLIFTWIGFRLAERAGMTFPEAVEPTNLNALIAALSCALAIGIGVAYVLRWRLIGETASLRVGIAVLLLGLGAYAVGDLLPIAAPSLAGAAGFTAVHAATFLVVAVLLVAAVVVPEIDTRVRPWRLTAKVTGVFALLALAFAAGPDGLRFLGQSSITPAVTDIEIAGQTVASIVWLGLAVCYMAVGFRRKRWLAASFALMLLGRGLAFGSSATAAPGDLWLTGGAAMELIGMIFALYGASHELRRAWAEQQSRLFEVETEFELHKEQRADEIARQEERIHDVRSAIVAIQGAAVGLEHDDDLLDAETRSSLARALAAEAHRLESLLTPPEPDERVVFDLAEVLEPVVTCHRSTDLGFAVELPEGLEVCGNPEATAEVVQNLLDNARRHAPGSPVSVRAGVEFGNAVLRVEDRGPGVDPNEREMIFERGRRGSRGSKEGSGLGLAVARRFMRDQGGDLWVEGRPGGGASFVLFLPSVGSRVAGGTEGFDQADDRRQAFDPHGSDAVRSFEDPFSPAVDWEPEHGPGEVPFVSRRRS